MVASAIAPDLLGVLRNNPSTASGQQRSLQLLQQLLVATSLPTHQVVATLARVNHEGGEPYLLPDTGVAGGLCGERWATWAGRWANQNSNKTLVGMLPKRREVHGVGAASQHAD